MRFMNLISLAATFLSISLVAATPAPPSTAQPPTVLSIVTSLQANLDSINAAVYRSANKSSSDDATKYMKQVVAAVTTATSQLAFAAPVQDPKTVQAIGTTTIGIMADIIIIIIFWPWIIIIIICEELVVDGHTGGFLGTLGNVAIGVLDVVRVGYPFQGNYLSYWQTAKFTQTLAILGFGGGTASTA